MKRRDTPLRMKLLDLTLIGLLGGAAPWAIAQDAGLQCDGQGCSKDGQTVVKIVSKGEQPAPEDDAGALQAQRRVEISQEVAGRSVSNRVMIDLPGGGMIWATEDPQLASPQLSVSAPGYAAFEQGRITKPISFNLYSNYAAFVQRYELLVFRGTDVDLVTPLAKLDVPVAANVPFTWDGAMSATDLREGEDLLYIVRAYGKDGNVDETTARRIQLLSDAEAELQQSSLRSAAVGDFAGLSNAEIQSRQLLAQSYGQDQLRQQNIRVYGSRVRVRGERMPESTSVSIGGQSVPIDNERKFVAEYLLPVGQHTLDVEIRDANNGTLNRPLTIDVTGKHFFMVALADVTVSDNSVSGAVVPVGIDDRYDEFLSEGRLAFYLKGKVQGKYLITAQADTREREVSELFSGFLEQDARDVFRRLDPDQYYPVYGDDSNAYRDVDTQGKFYVRIDWDKNQALWGNYQTGFSGTEYGQYVRSLYGAALSWRSHGTTSLGEPKAELRAFGSEAQTAPGHSEFLGTGGSLYYLRHTDLLPGSDVLVLETRDAASGRTEARSTLQRGVDYEIDELQGRILLTRPLSQIARDNLPSIIRDAPLDGFENRLIADYEYVPSGFSADNVTAGLRGKAWLGEHVAIGATYVDESRSSDDYSLQGADLTLQAGRGTYLKFEQARSESTGVPVFSSDNGGLSFSQLNPVGGNREGDARSIEARANFKELGWSERDWSMGAWHRDVDADFSVSRFDIGVPLTEYGAELAGQLSDSLRLYGRYSKSERGLDGFEQGNLQLQWAVNATDSFTTEIRRVTETIGGVDATGDLLAARYSKRFGGNFDLYGVAQLTLDDDGGAYADNDAFTLGARYLARNQSSVGAELTTGDRGDSATVDAEYRLTQDHAIYAGFTYSTDTTAGDGYFNTRQADGLTIGQRWRLSNQVNLYNESQFLKERNEQGIAHTFGMDFYPARGWTLGFTLQQAELENASGITDREAVSLSAGRVSPDTQWNSKLEFRRDSGAEQRTQWVSTNRFLHKFNPDWRVAWRFNYADTDDRLDPSADAKLIESNLGFAYRPVANDRLNLLGKVTYLHDLSSLGQDTLSDYDQRSLVFSLEGIYRLNDRWEVAGKAARREGEARLGRGTGVWFENSADYLAGQVRYDLIKRWDALVEYRWLQVDGGDSARKGWLVGVDRQFGDNFRVGVGYNFTEFSDNLTILDYDQEGWFLNLTGVY